MKIIAVSIVLLCSITIAQTSRHSTLLDDGSNAEVWKSFQSAGVEVHRQHDKGAIRFNVKFLKGSGYGGIIRNFNQVLPEVYEISFMMKATVPVNNFEVKLSDDSTGENIWWINKRSFSYPTEWKQITIKKRHLGYAWGTKYAQYPSKLSRLEIVVTAGTGGEGSVWIDNLTLTSIPSPPIKIPAPIVTVSSSDSRKGNPANTIPGKQGKWVSKSKKNEWLLIDAGYEKEFGAIRLDWDSSMKSVSYDILASIDGKKYELLKSMTAVKAGTVHHYLPESEARYIRLKLKDNAGGVSFQLHEWDIIGIETVSSPNQLYEQIAHSAPLGFYPRYYLKQQSYWTVVGVPSDTREALFSEDGMLEVDRQKFSLEPFIVTSEGQTLLHWSNGINTQSLEEKYLPIPSVERNYNQLILRITPLAQGAPEHSSVLVQYVVKNISTKQQRGSFFLTLRPFQVNPSSQFLNYDGGFAKTERISMGRNRAMVDDKRVIVSGFPQAYGATINERGDIVEFIRNNIVPADVSVNDPQGMASAAFQYPFDLSPGDSLTVIAAVPLTEGGDKWKSSLPTSAEFEQSHAAMKGFWISTLNTVKFSVPGDAQRLVDILRTNLAYILINKDKYGFQPGSRSYERSWIRDGSMTSDALLKLGITEEPKKYLEWYSSYQYENGAVPCVVDTRGPDPVPEHDSHGQLIFGCMEYFRFTKDTAFLRARWGNIKAAVAYIQSLRAQRMTSEYQTSDTAKRIFYGLVTESISHEGYSDKPMHSYWDNFFALKGMKDAAAAAKILGEKNEAIMYDSLVKAYRSDLYNSVTMTMSYHKISYIPGCAEKGDFDATSTSIALFPNGELKFVPQPAYQRTFDKYYDWFVQRSNNTITWDAYTPYEIRNVGSFVYLGQKERAHSALDYFLKDVRPAGWNHWAEVVANGYRTMRFIGDMPHTWVGSDYINAIRAMFVYENDDDHSIVIGAGLKESWIKNGFSVENLPTHYGNLSYTISPVFSDTLTMMLTGESTMNYSLLLIPVTLQSAKLKSVTVNGKQVKPENGYISVKELPATVKFIY